MKFGLSDKELSFLIDTVKLPLNKASQQVWIFGSRARGDHSRYSDIDLLIEGENPPTLLIGEIADQLEESNLPYKVDLVIAKELADAYRANVTQDKILL